jgi:hypothetical protein
MKKKTIWGHPGLCLCLILPLLLISCAIKKDNKTARPFTQNQVWRVDVTIVPEDIAYRIPESIPDGLISIKPAINGNINNSGQPQMLLLSFRVYDPAQLQLLREKLSATGMVRSILITPPSN